MKYPSITQPYSRSEFDEYQKNTAMYQRRYSLIGCFIFVLISVFIYIAASVGSFSLWWLYLCTCCFISYLWGYKVLSRSIFNGKLETDANDLLMRAPDLMAAQFIVTIHEQHRRISSSEATCLLCYLEAKTGEETEFQVINDRYDLFETAKLILDFVQTHRNQPTIA